MCIDWSKSGQTCRDSPKANERFRDFLNDLSVQTRITIVFLNYLLTYLVNENAKIYIFSI